MIAPMLAAGLLAAAAAAATAAAEPAPEPAALPHGVVLRAASADAQARAQRSLQALLADGDEAALARAMNPLPRPGRMPMMLGTFATLEVTRRPDYAPAQLRTGNGKVPISSDVPMAFPIVGASGVEHRVHLARHLRATLPAGAPRALRAPSFEELALVWFFIGWDLDGPLLVAEWDRQRVLFDFEPGGEWIEWIERLDRPCFTLRIEQKNLDDCYCLGIERQGTQWRATYVPADAFPDTPSCGAHDATDA